MAAWTAPQPASAMMNPPNAAVPPPLPEPTVPAATIRPMVAARKAANTAQSAFLRRMIA